ncbi:hypothetical protein LEN26_005919 [Aphanomyces euteiches]|uniref:PHD-type domain-containing protein n=1 Tax=Aphanomyces euteiches TaxID=100861 RepID=A0A6G0WJP8_9STRA|nr:hypothetical protein Ae201684_014486 [Aphanomyces euteiches]KAH9088832.1 hypothetical protein Ae201684P_013046 [Aphanomyces euteiches]KAH9101650.1 hypothetical protein AeMF1_021649 [Aphanomyces euteiches]KAH9137097.1 hypothetical protein LEN26_005919 [Aphanomyces euteiches]KAH9157528.1 hypothetical protein AeRB84_000630 [Aphanomyces euteiches]
MTTLDMPMTSVPLGEKSHVASYSDRNLDNLDTKSKATKSSNDKVKLDRSPVNANKIVYPPRLLVDFNSLHIDALNKYVAFYSIPVREEYTKDDIAALVARHFDCSLEVEEDESILSFVTRVRNGEKTTRTRPPAPKNTQASKKVAKEESKTSTKRAREAEEEDGDKDEEVEAAQPPPPKKSTKSSNKSSKDKSSDKNNDDNELYCVCNLPGYGAMIACDGKQCPNPSQWYHLECVGFSDGQHPDTWLCPECDPKAFATVQQKKKKKNRNKVPEKSKDSSRR